MNVVWVITKILTANILLIIVSSTLIGFIIRGLLQPRISNVPVGHKTEWYSISPTIGLALSLGSACLTVVVTILLIRYTNIYIAIGFLSWMLIRIKDLTREIRTGVKTTNKTMTRDKLDFVLTLISWIGLIVFNYGLYLLWIA